MGAVGLNRAAGAVQEPRQRLEVANTGWGAWAPVEAGTDRSGDTPTDVAKAQRQLKVLQWTIPALTGAMLVVNAAMGDQQRPARVAGGLLGRLRPAA
jgi:hypothetical protein